MKGFNQMDAYTYRVWTITTTNTVHAFLSFKVQCKSSHIYICVSCLRVNRPAIRQRLQFIHYVLTLMLTQAKYFISSNRYEANRDIHDFRFDATETGQWKSIVAIRMPQSRNSLTWTADRFNPPWLASLQLDRSL